MINLGRIIKHHLKIIQSSYIYIIYITAMHILYNEQTIEDLTMKNQTWSIRLKRNYIFYIKTKAHH